MPPAALSPLSHSPRRQFHPSPLAIQTPKYHSPFSQYQPSATDRPSLKREGIATLESTRQRMSFVSGNSVILLQNSHPDVPNVPFHDEDDDEKALTLGRAAWIVFSSIVIGAVFLSVMILFKGNGIIFLTSYLLPIINYEMSWYSHAIIQTLLRPFQIYYDMDAVATATAEDKSKTTVAQTWGGRVGASDKAMGLVISTLVMFLCAGVTAVLQLYGNLGLSSMALYMVLPYVATTTFVAVGCAMFTPSPMDGCILLLQQIAFSVTAFNSFFSYKEAVHGGVRQITLVDGGYSIAIVLVPIVIFRIVRSTEVVRTGLVLLLDLFCVQYVTSTLMLLATIVDNFLAQDQVLVDFPQHRMLALVSCFLTLWVTDLVTQLLIRRPKWAIVACGIIASIIATVVLKYAIAPPKVELCQWYHIVFIVLGSCLCHVGKSFVAFFRLLAGNARLSRWLVRLQYLLLLGVFVMLYERVAWVETFSTTVDDSIRMVTQMWVRIDNTSYQAFDQNQSEYQFLYQVRTLMEMVHASYTPAKMDAMFVRNTHHFLFDVGTCVVQSIQENVTGKQCFSMF
ncbi:hypothetical protein LEN26_012779 [Aphanomyces euteiches]|nr:hypothetical protein AeMF1_016752 [Aphanomyces euteiches]KAH9117125.1 hypothetical protein LEN26_012779 [Aphanomyces euteiches]KAH9197592.1 hypothetical protein AeNC1_000464 [Aphanomyces euteiches]